MPRRPKAIPRNQPDTLFKLCLRHRDLLIKAIGTGLIANPNSLQVKLIMYYLQLNGGFDRENEKSAWANCDLKSLKYETYRLVIRVLSQVAEWDKREIYSKISEIEFALKTQGYAYALDIIELTLPKAIEIEEYALAIQIIDLQALIYDQINDEVDIAIMLASNNRLRNEIMRLLVEVQDCLEFRRAIVEPIKRDWEKNEKISEVKIEGLRRELERLQAVNLVSKKSKLEYLSAKSMDCLLQGKIHEGHLHLGELLELYKVSDLLKGNRSRYIQHLRAYSLLSAQLGLEVIARDCLSLLWRIFEERTEIQTLALYSWIKAGLRIGYHFDDINLAQKAVSLFELHRDEIESEVKESEWVRLNWWTMTILAENGQLEQANRIGMILLSKKTAMKENWLICARIFVFAIAIALFSTDEDRINDTYRACYEFLRRNKEEYPEAILVLRKFWDMWKASLAGNDIAEMPQSPLYPTLSGNKGTYDFYPLYLQVLERLKGHR
jgi:hypothetical protein